MIAAFWISFAVLVLDALTKGCVAAFLPYDKAVTLIPGVLRFSNVSNEGMAFGLLADKRWIFMAATVVLCLCLAAVMIWVKGYTKMVYVSFSFILGGGLGNLIDRLVCFGRYDEPASVVDFVDFCAFPNVWKWTFNVADIAVCVGVGLLVVYLVFFERKAKKAGYQTIWLDSIRDRFES